MKNVKLSMEQKRESSKQISFSNNLISPEIGSFVYISIKALFEIIFS